MRNSLLYATLTALSTVAACSAASQDLRSNDKNGATADNGSSTEPTPMTPAPTQPGDAGAAQADAPGPTPNSSAKRIFVTSLSYTADLASEGSAATGLLGADSLCNEHAKQASLGGNWVAWLSTSTEDAIDRIADVGPWYLVDRLTKVFPSKFQIPAGPLVHIDVDELGKHVSGEMVWTGTDSHGHYDISTRHDPSITITSGNNIVLNGCANWTSAANGWNDWAATGWTSSLWTGASWDLDSADPCYAHHRLYCFEK